MEFLVLSSFARHVGEWENSTTLNIINSEPSLHSLKFYFKSLTTFSAKVLLTILSNAGLSGIKSAL